MNKLKHFSYETDRMLACPCCGTRGMVPSVMRDLDNLRDESPFPFIITSGYRCPSYNSKNSSTGLDGPHTTGRSVDIHVIGGEVYSLLPKLHKYGFTGIGLSQKGEHRKRFMHIDNLKDHETKGPRPWVWTY